jgi:hypothetical protein
MIPSYVIFYMRVIPIHGSVSSSLLLLCKHELFYCQVMSVNVYYYYYHILRHSIYDLYNWMALEKPLVRNADFLKFTDHIILPLVNLYSFRDRVVD